MKQEIISCSNLDTSFKDILDKHATRSILWVCTNSFRKQDLYTQMQEIVRDYEVTEFSDFEPNPKYESVCAGVALFREKKADFIIATGGGSALDVAKCIKLFSGMNDAVCYLEQPLMEVNVPILAVPTTAGTGSEATRFAVIYYNGVKQSVSHESCIPEYVILEPKLLKTLPDYQKKVTMFDALGHAIESFWSVHSTEESREYAKEAIRLVMDNEEGYLAGTEEGHANMMLAANIAGKAINITQTTAGHAMSYKLTSMYGIAHGHAVALCIAKLWPYMLNHMQNCVDSRGEDFLGAIFDEIAQCMNADSPEEATATFVRMMQRSALQAPNMQSEQELQILCDSVNVGRLKNNPVLLEKQDIHAIYQEIFSKE